MEKKDGKFEKGQVAWNKGISPNEEIKKRMSEACKGRKHTEETKKKMSISRRKGISRHSSYAYKEWKNNVKEIDNWICRNCGCTDKRKLHAHHIIPWKINESKRFDIENGITLCSSCHSKIEGNTPAGWNKGKKLTESHKKKLSEAKKGKKAPSGAFKKGRIPWNKGLKFSGNAKFSKQ